MPKNIVSKKLAELQKSLDRLHLCALKVKRIMCKKVPTQKKDTPPVKTAKAKAKAKTEAKAKVLTLVMPDFEECVQSASESLRKIRNNVCKEKLFGLNKTIGATLKQVKSDLRQMVVDAKNDAKKANYIPRDDEYLELFREAMVLTTNKELEELYECMKNPRLREYAVLLLGKLVVKLDALSHSKDRDEKAADPARVKQLLAEYKYQDILPESARSCPGKAKETEKKMVFRSYMMRFLFESREKLFLAIVPLCSSEQHQELLWILDRLQAVDKKLQGIVCFEGKRLYEITSDRVSEMQELDFLEEEVEHELFDETVELEMATSAVAFDARFEAEMCMKEASAFFARKLMEPREEDSVCFTFFVDRTIKGQYTFNCRKDTFAMLLKLIDRAARDYQSTLLGKRFDLLKKTGGAKFSFDSWHEQCDEDGVCPIHGGKPMTTPSQELVDHMSELFPRSDIQAGNKTKIRADGAVSGISTPAKVIIQYLLTCGKCDALQMHVEQLLEGES
jgi:hypothetical protein